MLASFPGSNPTHLSRESLGTRLTVLHACSTISHIYSLSLRPSCSVTFSVPGFGTSVLTVVPVCTCECSREENHVRETMSECEAMEKKVVLVHLCAKHSGSGHWEGGGFEHTTLGEGGGSG